MEGYALRYYKRYALNGQGIELSIFKKYDAVEYAPPAMEIGRVLQGLSLDVQGEQDDITAPIVKTSLSMTFADAPGEQPGKKTGDWEEFYTPDSMAFKIELRKNGVLMWSGYITPDSFEEDLEYRGSVTLVARDNIGHLQDFEFDAEGDEYAMISVRDIIDMAFAKVSCLLFLEYPNGNDIVWPTCEGVTALDCLVNVEAFKDKNWYEALEAVLDSFGLAMRYVGANKIVVMPLRSLPCLSQSQLSAVEVRDMLIEAAGHRSLAAAAKCIRDVGKYDIENEVATKNVRSFDFTGDQSLYKCKIDGDNYGRLEHDAPVWPIASKLKGWANPVAAQTSFFNVDAYEPGYFLQREEDEVAYKRDDLMYIAANNVDDRSVQYVQRIRCRPLSLVMQFGEPLGLTSTGQLAKFYDTSMHLRKVVYQLVISDENVSARYWDGEAWTLQATEVTVTYDTSSAVSEFAADINFAAVEEETLMMTFRIKKIEYYAVGPLAPTASGVYARVQKFLIKVPDDVVVYDESIVNSVYDENLNYLISRDPALVAPVQSFAVPKVVRNGIYLPDNGYTPAMQWKWPDGKETSLQAIIAEQILMYYSQPNSVITGTLLANPQQKEVLGFDCLWRWRGKKFVLISGQLDLMTGSIENAKLREFKEWSELWPIEGHLITEDAEAYITSEEGNKYKVGKKTI